MTTKFDSEDIEAMEKAVDGMTQPPNILYIDLPRLIDLPETSEFRRDVARHLLAIFDEAEGLPDGMWDLAEKVLSEIRNS